MTLLDKMAGGNQSKPETNAETPKKEEAVEKTPQSSASELLNTVESQFEKMMEGFNAVRGFSVETGDQAVDTMIELLSSKEVAVSITVLLSYIRYCVNHGIKKDITLKIGYNKPPAIPMNFAINEELLGDIYPGDVVEIN